MLYEDYPDNDKVVEFKMRGLDFLIQRIERFEKNNPDKKISEFINLITLDNKDDINDDQGKVNLLTMHAAKGLEYDIVYLPGLEDNIIPSSKAMMENEDSIYEERRLFYVAITRARKELTLSYAKERKDYMGEMKQVLPSRFLEEIPPALLKEKLDMTEEDKLQMLDDLIAQLSGK
jgi:Superfamily I DNA and RNA helicases